MYGHFALHQRCPFIAASGVHHVSLEIEVLDCKCVCDLSLKTFCAQK